MSNYYDDMLAQIMWDQIYPQGHYRKVKNQYGAEWDVENDPMYQGPNARRGAKMQASQAEDEKLRGLLGSSRARRRGEQQGAYALAEYPELRNAVDWARTGELPGGSATIQLWLKEQSNPQLRAENMNKRKQWAARQGQLMGWW